MSFSPPAAACVTVKVPRAPSSNSSSADTWSTTLRPGTSAPTSAATRVTGCPLTKLARCCVWQPIALITSASPLRSGSSSQRSRLFCGPSSMRVASANWMYSTCTKRTAPIALSRTSWRAWRVIG